MSKKKMSPENDQPILVYPQKFQQEDELNFVDLIKVLFKRKIIILVCLFCFLIIGLAQFFLAEDLYNYSTVINLGNIENLQGTKLNVVNTFWQEYQIKVKVKVAGEYIPLVLTKYNKEKKSSKQLNMSSSLNSKSNVLSLTTQFNRGELAQISILHHHVEQLIVSHNSIIFIEAQDLLKNVLGKLKKKLNILADKKQDSIKKIVLDNEIEQLSANTKNLQNELEIVMAKIEKFGLAEDLKRSELVAINTQLDEFYKMKAEIIVQELKGKLLLISKTTILSEIEKLSAKGVKLQKIIQVDSPINYKMLGSLKYKNLLKQQQNANQIRLIKAKLVELKLLEEQEIISKQIKIKWLQNKIGLISPPKVIIETHQSYAPIPSSKKEYLVLSLILGLFIGLFGVFIAEFSEKLKASST